MGCGATRPQFEHHTHEEVVNAPRPCHGLNKNSRVVVVGAGIAGIHMAARFKKAGYKNVRVIERSHRIGGKVYDVSHPAQNGQHFKHRIGAFIILSSYVAIPPLVEEYGVGPMIRIGGPDYPGPRGDRYVGMHVHDPRKHKSHEDVRYYDRREWTTKHMARCKHPLPLLKGIEIEKVQGLRLLTAVKRYGALHRSYFGTYTSILPRPTPEVMKEIDMSYAEWLEKNHLEILEPLLLFFVVAQGYGTLQTMPAYYGLLVINPSVMESALNEPLHGIDFARTLPNGVEELLHKMVEKEEIQVELGCKVVQVTRPGEGDDQDVHTDEPIRIRCQRQPAYAGDEVDLKDAERDGDAKAEEDDFVDFECDYMVICTPLKKALNFLDATPNEQELFSAQRYKRVVITLYEADARQDEVSLTYYPDRIQNRLEGSQIAEVNSHAMVDPDSFDKMRDDHRKEKGDPNAQPKTQRIAYQYVTKADVAESVPTKQLLEDAAKGIIEDNKELGIDIRVIKQVPFDYFFHWDNAEIEKGYPWKLLDMQGTRRTWYAGSSATFESMDQTVQYNNLLFDLFLPKDE